MVEVRPGAVSELLLELEGQNRRKIARELYMMRDQLPEKRTDFFDSGSLAEEYAKKYIPKARQ